MCELVLIRVCVFILSTTRSNSESVTMMQIAKIEVRLRCARCITAIGDAPADWAGAAAPFSASAPIGRGPRAILSLP
jgi:hypothetical protein